ncbi:MAG: hypothetical protein ACLU4Q_05570 [Streptococcus thermophilus]
MHRAYFYQKANQYTGDYVKDVPKYSIASLLMFLGIYMTKLLTVPPYINLFMRIIVGGVIYGVGLLLLKPQLVKISIENKVC